MGRPLGNENIRRPLVKRPITPLDPESKRFPDAKGNTKEL
jgi:hypothetical protein